MHCQHIDNAVCCVIPYYIMTCLLCVIQLSLKYLFTVLSSRILATEIGKLKIRQEQVELRELQFDSEDETGIVSVV